MLKKIPAPDSFIQPPPDLGTFDHATKNISVYFGVSNSGVIETDEGLVIVDAQMSPSAASDLFHEIRKITDKDIRCIINTHYHGDHTYGNVVWRKMGIPIIGSKLTAQLMISREKRMKLFYKSKSLPSDDIPIVTPNFLFNQEFLLNLGGVEIQLKNLGPGETDDSIVVCLPKEGVLFTNDTVECNGFPIFGMPVMNEGLDGDGQFLETLTAYAALGPETIIPGHGHISDVSSIWKMREIAAFFLRSVDEAIVSGKSFEQIYSEVQALVPLEYKEMPPIWGTIDAAIRRAYRSLTGWSL